jgi:hypothetical protein
MVLTISTIPSIAQIIASILTRSNHTSMDGRSLSHKYTSQTQHHKGWKTCMTLKIAWLSITNQVWTQISKVWGIGNNINACMPVCILEKESIYDQYGQGPPALLSRLLLKILLVELLEVLKVVSTK